MFLYCGSYFFTGNCLSLHKYLHKYYEDKGLQVIDIYDLPAEVVKRSEGISLDEELGRKTYALLELLQK